MKRRNPYIYTFIILGILILIFLYNYFGKIPVHQRAKQLFQDGKTIAAINLLEKEDDIISAVNLSNIYLQDNDFAKSLSILKKWENDTLIGDYLKKRRLSIFLEKGDTSICLDNFRSLPDTIKNKDMFIKFKKLDSLSLITALATENKNTKKEPLADSIFSFFSQRLDSLIPNLYSDYKKIRRKNNFEKVFLTVLKSAIRSKDSVFTDSLEAEFSFLKIPKENQTDFRPEVMYRFGDVYEDRKDDNKSGKYFETITIEQRDSAWTKKAFRRLILLKYRTNKSGQALRHLETLRVLCDSTDQSALLLFCDYWTAKIHFNLTSYKYSQDLIKEILKRDYDGYYGYRALELLNKMKKKGLDTFKPHVSISDIDQSFPAVSQPLPNDPETRKIKLLLNCGLYNDASQSINTLINELSYIRSLQISSTFQLAKLCTQNDYHLKTSHLLSQYFPEYLHDHYSSPQLFFEMLFPRPFREIIKIAANTWNFSENEIYSVIKQESGFLVNAKSHVGALGLMQLMPSTAENMEKNVKAGFRKPSNLYIPAINIPLGTAFLAKCRNEFNNIKELYIPSYNAGIDKVKEWQLRYENFDSDLFVEYIPYKESRNFTKLVLRNMHAYNLIYN